MKKILWKPPRLRIGEGAEGERHATWLELFYDLLFAAVVAQLTFQLSQDLSGFGVLTFVGIVRAGLVGLGGAVLLCHPV